MKYTAVLSILFFTVTLQAQELPDTSQLDPVEVRAVRASAAAPFAKTNLVRRDIVRQNVGVDLPFLLNQTPSVVVSSDAGNGIGYTGIRIRGTDATRMNVTINGIPYNDAESQGTFLVNLPDLVSSVNSIQIQRGVGTSTNGAGSFGATINLSTNEVNKTSYAEFNNSYGSFNSWKNTIRAGSGLMNGHFTTDVRLSRISSDGYIDRARTDLSSFYISSAYLSNKTDLRLNVFSGKEETYQAWNGVPESLLKTNRRYNSAGTAKPGTPYDNETDNYKQDHYQLFFTQRIKEGFTANAALFWTKGRGYYEQYRSDEDYADYLLPYPVVGSDTSFSSDLVRRLWLDNDFFGGTFSVQYKKNKTDLIAGGSATRYNGHHFGEVIWAQKGMPEPKSRWYDLDANKSDLNAYAKLQQSLTGYLLLFADVQYRHVDYDIYGFRKTPGLAVNSDYNFLNPKIGLSFQLKNALVYGSYSLAHKEPNRDDFEAGLTRQPKQERLHDVEAGIEIKKNRFTGSLGGYYMRYKDQLVLTGEINDVGAYTRTNIPDSYRLGMELQGAWMPLPWAQIGGNLSLSRNRVHNFVEFLDNWDNGGQTAVAYLNTDLSFSPNIIGGATVTLRPVRRMNLDFLSKYVGKQFLDNTRSKERQLNSFFTEDFRITYSLAYKFIKNIDIVFQLNNVFNKKYEPNGFTYTYIYNSNRVVENSYFPMAGRNFFTGINLRF